MEPIKSPATEAEAENVPLMAVGGKTQFSEVDMGNSESFLKIRTDCVIELRIPSGMTFNTFSMLSEIEDLALMAILVFPIMFGRITILKLLTLLGSTVVDCEKNFVPAFKKI